MKKNDIILLFCILACCAIALTALFLLLNGTGEVAVVRVDGEEYARLPLDKDTELLVQTELGCNLVVIEDGKAFIREADCPDKVCCVSGHANEMRSVVCAPHKLTLTVQAEEQ